MGEDQEGMGTAALGGAEALPAAVASASLVAAFPCPAATGSSSAPMHYEHRRSAGEVHRCKKGHRSDLSPKDWEKYGYAKNEEILSRPIAYDGVQTLPLPRIRRDEVTVQSFYENYMLRRRPCIIEGGMNHWPGMTEWEPKRLEERMRQASFKVGEDDKGRKLRLKYKYYLDYMRTQKDDSPLYLFETKMEADMQTRTLLNDFEVPDIFPHDLFDLVNPTVKPPFRWWSIGPKRSGTTVHIDPLGTAAWNAVTHGKKRWVLFEPEVPVRVAKGKDVVRKDLGEDDEAIHYFDFLLPRIKAKHPDVRVYEGIQGAGDLIYVPGDWWHGVLNLEDTVAVTQNFCGLDNFERVWSLTRKQRKKLSYHWLRNMRKFSPELYNRAMEMNRRDGFKMRHQKGSDDESSSESDSSSSESSSDSSSDNEVDLQLKRVLPFQVCPPWRLGAVSGAAGAVTTPHPAPPTSKPSLSISVPPPPLPQGQRPSLLSASPPCVSPPIMDPPYTAAAGDVAMLHNVPACTPAADVPPRKRPHVLGA